MDPGWTGTLIAVMKGDGTITMKGVFMQVENRLFKRYPIPDDTLYVFCTDSSVKGWVRDISSNGIGIGYFSAEEFRLKPDVKLILAGNKINVYIPDIKCKRIYDQSMDLHEAPYKRTGARQCGVQFGKLNAETKKKLQAILDGQASA